MARNFNKRRWMNPSKRGASYAADRKAKVHTYGKKVGQELTDYEQGVRSGYLLCQSDQAGMYRYKKALAEGKTKAQAKAYSQSKR